MLIDVSFYTRGRRRIQNASCGAKLSVDSEAVGEYINDYIEDYQYEYLRKMLGEEVAEQVSEYLATTEGNSLAERDDDMEVLCAHLRESYADYVYFFMLRDSGKYVTINGVMQTSADNTHISPIEAQVSIWNEMVRKNEEFYKWACTPACKYDVVIDRSMLEPVNEFNL